jgi:trehalose-6-phosphate synthase
MQSKDLKMTEARQRNLIVQGVPDSTDAKSMRLPLVRPVIKSLGDLALIIGVDRLNYSNGIAEWLSAFERFLHRQVEWRGKSGICRHRAGNRSGRWAG